jgi:DNA replication ATP-dependent helicase Dna2
MPSTQARTKLKAFQFIEGVPTEENLRRREEEKENQLVASQPKETPKTSKVMDFDLSNSKTPKFVHSKTCPPPSTPATRLPLADLVGNADDSRRNLPQPEISPEEQLGWHGSQPTNTPIPRKRKRARSSSPVVASQEELKMVDIQKNEHTPVADPATELWNKYTSNKGVPSANKTVTFAHLINESSPRSSAQAGSVSGLRRWASCGVEFPTSATKKRRTKGMFKPAQDVSGDVFSSSDGVVEGQTEKPKLADMLQRMRDALPQTRSKMSSQQLPSSSSPLPEVGAGFEPLSEPSDSPIQQRQKREQDVNGSQSVEEDMNAIDEATNVVDAVHQRSSASSDDFGDIDLEMVDALEISQRAPEYFKNQVTAQTAPVKPASEVQPQLTEASPAPKASAGSDDEFDIDEDSFAADLEQVASLYDNRPEVTPSCDKVQPPELQRDDVAKKVTSPVVHVIEDDSDDDFGEDIDADEFAAAEVAATQGHGTVCGDVSSVAS